VPFNKRVSSAWMTA